MKGRTAMSTDPTEYPRPLEPTQAVHYNPYEQTSPYDNIPIRHLHLRNMVAKGFSW
jgi:hypothetical protein